MPMAVSYDAAVAFGICVMYFDCAYSKCFELSTEMDSYL